VDQQNAAYGFITCEVERSTLVITLNRPDRLNAYTGEMGSEIEDAFRKVDADDDIRAIIVTGAGLSGHPNALTRSPLSGE